MTEITLFYTFYTIKKIRETPATRVQSGAHFKKCGFLPKSRYAGKTLPLGRIALES